MNVSRVFAAGLGQGWALRGSTATRAGLHAGHGTTLLVGLETEVQVESALGLARGRAVVVPPDVPHTVESAGPTAGFLYDPELFPRVAWSARSRGVCALPGAEALRVIDATSAVRADLGSASVLRGLAAEVAGLMAPQRAETRRDRRVDRVLDTLRQQPAAREDALRTAGISPAHLQELFVRDVGIPLRRWRLWQKLIAAVGAYARMDAAGAAHHAGFADAAHFSRTCRRMLGYHPTGLRGGFTPTTDR